MRAVVQRVTRAAVFVHGETVGQIGAGLLVYAAAAPDDAESDVRYIAEKVATVRIFEDAEGKMNLAVGQPVTPADGGGGMHPAIACGGESPASVLLISAFTVLADARKGRRPSFDSSAGGAIAAPLIEMLASAIRAQGLGVETGRFAADMQVESVNDGPICILLDSRRVI